eukprot:CAMPEP_0180117130 /NCGR_PEP_ID=MMETSP0986-20121125/756_1 /TAXON_ID=697907 /ORGANISM="non described non described, Strain CCMP2293" /LENGTH=146 /DNA_ID=CAMNT_0022055987 /DNA_START=660 /DNA_END=1101 /DNA_ORIENTATION=+
MRPVDDGMLDPSRRLLHEEQLRLDAIEVDMHAPRGRMLVPLIPLVLPPLLVRCSCAEGAAGGCALVPVDHAPVALLFEQRSGLSERTEWKVLLDAPELRRRSLTGVVRSGDMLREPPLLLMAGLRVPGCVFAGDRSRNRSRWASGK